MPTGYTAGVQDGTVTTLNEFARLCARAFGANIHLRDVALGTDWAPQEADEGGYHARAIEQATRQRGEAIELTEAQADDTAAGEYREAEKAYQRRLAETEKQAGRYRTMLHEVQCWVPPTPEHVEFKRFMLEQLSESLRADCSTGEPPVHQTGQQYKMDLLSSAQWSLNYHTEQLTNERERVAKNNAWNEVLHRSL